MRLHHRRLAILLRRTPRLRRAPRLRHNMGRAVFPSRSREARCFGRRWLKSRVLELHPARVGRVELLRGISPLCALE